MKKKYLVTIFLLVTTLYACGINQSSQPIEYESKELASSEEHIIYETTSETDNIVESFLDIEKETTPNSEMNNEKINSNVEFEYASELQEYLVFENMIYNSSFTNFAEDVELNQIELKMELVQEIAEGKIYNIRIDSDLQFMGRYEWGMDLFNLGYLLFTKDEILYVEQLYGGDIPTIDEFLSLGYVVLSTINSEIPYCRYIDEGVEFYHMDDSANEYFTHMVWEKGKGMTVFQNGCGTANWRITLDK